MLSANCPMRTFYISALLLFGAAVSASCSDSKSFTPVVVELFTSEGCSSCPPADAFLHALDARQPIEGVHLIVMEEHVDYWDDQGWKDPFSSHDMTVRQISYAQSLHAAEPYTPQMVVDGAFEFIGSDSRRALDVFQKARALAVVSLQISSVKTENGKLTAHVETGAVPREADVFAALVLEHAESQVKRGENGGHHLEHVAVVRSLTKIGKVENGQPFLKDVSLDARSVPRGRVVVFLQEVGQGKILGAAVEKF